LGGFFGELAFLADFAFFVATWARRGVTRAFCVGLAFSAEAGASVLVCSPVVMWVVSPYAVITAVTT
jgi:hypothetical protein